jgi:hypothetical protein
MRHIQVNCLFSALRPLNGYGGSYLVEKYQKQSGRTNVSYLVEKYQKRKRMQFGQTLLTVNMSLVGHKVHLQALNVWIIRATILGKSYTPFNAAWGTRVAHTVATLGRPFLHIFSFSFFNFY